MKDCQAKQQLPVKWILKAKHTNALVHTHTHEYSANGWIAYIWQLMPGNADRSNDNEHRNAHKHIHTSPSIYGAQHTAPYTYKAHTVIKYLPNPAAPNEVIFMCLFTFSV